MTLLARLLAAVLATGVAMLWPAEPIRPLAWSEGAGPQNAIQRENMRPGTIAWELNGKRAGFHRLSGYAWATSVAPGASIAFSVSTTAKSYRVDVYRMGWYRGDGGRLMRSFPRLAGHAWPVPALDPKTGMLACGWPRAFSLDVPRAWVSGIYLAKLTSSTGYEAYIPFVVRSLAPTSRFVLIRSVNTEQAYNAWESKSLYSDVGTRGPAVKVSFDRPLADEAGAGDFLSWEFPTLFWLEEKGYDVSYLTDVDVDENPQLLLHRRGILVASHSEYWSAGMRDGIENAVNHGVNLAVLSANAGYWQVRYEALGGRSDRIMVCYKSASSDPMRAIDPTRVTVTWRDPLIHRPESALLGAMYGDFHFGHLYPMVIQHASNWVFAGTRLKDGDTLDGLVGLEWDRVVPGYPVPSHMTILASSPVANETGKRTTSNATLSTFKSGARVFDAGTLSWSTALSFHNRTGDMVRTVTANLLRNFASAGGTRSRNSSVLLPNKRLD